MYLCDEQHIKINHKLKRHYKGEVKCLPILATKVSFMIKGKRITDYDNI